MSDAIVELLARGAAAAYLRLTPLLSAAVRLGAAARLLRVTDPPVSTGSVD